MTNKYKQLQQLLIATIIIFIIISLVMCIKSINCKKYSRRSTANLIIPIDHITIQNDTIVNAVQYDETKEECVFTDAIAIQIPEAIYRV